MSFTDDDLKRVKEYTISITFSKDAAPEHTIDKFKDLLARLEAAERKSDLADCKCTDRHWSACVCGYKIRDEAWRKAAGK